jgi:hypothetical protein
MTTLREWFDFVADELGETVEFVVFGDKPSELVMPPPLRRGVTVAVADVPADVLDHEFYHGYGMNESPNFVAWTSGYVLFNDDYDGGEGLCWVPRNPMEFVMQHGRPGGGGQFGAAEW